MVCCGSVLLELSESVLSKVDVFNEMISKIRKVWFAWCKDFCSFGDSVGEYPKYCDGWNITASPNTFC